MPTQRNAKETDYGSTRTDAVGFGDGTPKISHVLHKHAAAAAHQAPPLLQHYHSVGDAADQRQQLLPYSDDNGDDESSIVTFASNKHDSARSGTLSLLRSSFLSHRDSLRDSLHRVVDRTFSLGGTPCDVRENEGTASVINEVFNLVKNLVGAGALGLPSGM
jgi:hypothetical protein